MTEYPEWLIDRVAKAVAFSQNATLARRWDDEDWEDGRKFWREDAIMVLDALGFQNDYDESSVWQSAYLYPAKGEI